MSYIGIILGLFIVWCVLAQVGARIIFRPQKKRWPLKLPFTSVHEGPLVGVYLAARPDKPTFVFFHGRGGNVSHFENFAQTYAPLGYGILMLDYRGFGLSKGTPSQKHIEEDSLAMVNYALKTLQIAPQNLVLYGHSLGNAGALYVAQHVKNLPLKALILQSPFLSTPDMAASWATRNYQPNTWKYRFIRALVMPFLWFNRFDNTRLISGLNLPILMCASKADATLPWQQSAKLVGSIENVHRFLSSTGGHDEFTWSAKAVDAFLSSFQS